MKAPLRLCLLGGHLWDVAFAGLNVYHYLPADRLADALANTAAVVKEGGYFISDFIAPDHVRWRLGK